MRELSRRELLAGTGAFAGATLLSGCTSTLATPSRAIGPTSAQALLDSIAENLLWTDPEQATSLGIDKGSRAPLRSRLKDRSAAGQDKIASILRADLARAETLDTRALDASTRTSIEVIKSAYRTSLEGFAQPYGDVAVGSWRNTPYVVIQNVGAYLDTPRFLDADHQIANAADAEAYVARLDSMALQLDGELARIRDARGKGLVPPAFLLDKAIGQLGQSLDNARKGGGLVDSLVNRTRDIPGSWETRSRAIVTGKIAPALALQLEELKLQRARATMDPGMWARPGGDAYYVWALKASTTTAMSPEEIHQMGRRELAELQARMDAILKRNGYNSGSVGQRMVALAKDPKYKFKEGDPGRAEILAYIGEWISKFRGLTPRGFNTLVRANLEVKRLPPEEEPGAPGAYGGAGSIDGSIPGKFWINLHTTDLHRRYDLPSLAAHEAIPGHVWQGEYANQLPLIRTLLSFNAYSEGWALYAEQLMDELGAYDDFEVGKLGYLQSLAFRACRLVVDTGLHAKRWSRQQAVQFFVDEIGSGAEDVAREVDRYCSWPGQACGYKVGHSEILRQRAKAQSALGSRFDLRAFNDAVVKGGNVPMDVLARNVDGYAMIG
ncbi:DUF885 domain-containing protein [Sphingomonas sp. HDW15A]|uniref:DUF885 domain-containing protein n=1 Tax=Sphingomonas sp. HDW15A TaxID=2714942 RepID=UPI00140CC368|nr:DUF885 domain-containing protein [Sphingomonas sp. HDW15A]QIK96169.1 DUF885 domain-containing protein [Sphingomonas sp. HDW15A]